MSLSMKDKSNRKKHSILAGIFLGIAALLGIERCVNDEPEPEPEYRTKDSRQGSITVYYTTSLFFFRQDKCAEGFGTFRLCI